MSETRKISAILVADVVGYSRPAGSDEERTLTRLRALRRDLTDPPIAVRSPKCRFDRTMGKCHDAFHGPHISFGRDERRA